MKKVTNWKRNRTQSGNKKQGNARNALPCFDLMGQSGVKAGLVYVLLTVHKPLVGSLLDFQRAFNTQRF